MITSDRNYEVDNKLITEFYLAHNFIYFFLSEENKVIYLKKFISQPILPPFGLWHPGRRQHLLPFPRYTPYRNYSIFESVSSNDILQPKIVHISLISPTVFKCHFFIICFRRRAVLLTLHIYFRCEQILWLFLRRKTQIFFFASLSSNTSKFCSSRNTCTWTSVVKKTLR